MKKNIPPERTVVVSKHLYKEAKEMIKPKVAVAIFTYNHDKFITDCLDSIYAQTYDNFDVFLFDNNSSDSTVRFVENFKKLNYEIEMVKSFNTCSIGHIRHNAIESIKQLNRDYKYIAIIDGDDRWTPDKLKKQVMAAEKYNLNLVFSDCYYLKYSLEEKKEFPVMWYDKEEWLDGTFFDRYPPSNSNHFENLMIGHNYMPCPTLLFELNSLYYRLKNPMAYISAEDYDWILRVSLLSDKIGYINEPLAYYRIHPDQATKRTPVRCSYEELDCMRRFKKWLPKHLMKKYWKKVFVIYLKMIYKELFV